VIASFFKFRELVSGKVQYDMDLPLQYPPRIATTVISMCCRSNLIWVSFLDMSFRGIVGSDQALLSAGACTQKTSGRPSKPTGIAKLGIPAFVSV